MIKKLQLEDICKINKVELNEVKSMYLDWVSTPATNTNSYPVIPKEQHFKLDKKYDSNTNEKVLNEIIQKLKQKSYEGTDYEGSLDCEFGCMEKPTELDLRKVIVKINLSSNKIAHKGRIGPAQSIIFDTLYIPFFDNIIKTHGTFGLTNFYHYPGLGDKVISFRKNDVNYSSLMLFHNDNLYDFGEVGDFSKQYNVVTLKCKKQLRQKKLQRILNEE